MSASLQMSAFNCSGRYILRPQDWERIRLSLRLSLREIQITQCIFDDQKTECIAIELGISSHTVNTYLQRLYIKVDVHSRPQLILRVMQVHLEYLGVSCKVNAIEL
jgi:DNA-binding CsgD family transcriptional regulator